MKHFLIHDSALHATTCEFVLLLPSRGLKHIQAPTSFNYYEPQYFDAKQLAHANRYLDEEDDGRVIIKRAKDTEGGGLMSYVPPPVYKKEPNKGNNMPKESKWKEDKKKDEDNPMDEPLITDKPPVGIQDLWKWVAYKNMQRAREAAIIADNALIEVRKQQAAAKYHAHEALIYEAAALRSLRHGGKAAGRSVEPPPKLKINEYPVPPDAQWSSGSLLSPPGWEAPGAAQVPLHGPVPTNSFRITGVTTSESSAPWWLACVPRYQSSEARRGKTKLPLHSMHALFL